MTQSGHCQATLLRLWDCFPQQQNGCSGTPKSEVSVFAA
jgi:hypothetical protein